MKRRAWLGTLAGLTVILVSLLIPLSTRAYNLEGPRWPGQPSPHHCCADVYWEQDAVYSKDVIGWDDGANAWTDSAAYVIFYGSNVPNIYAQDTDNSSVGWDGLTSYSWYTGDNGIEYFNNGTVVTLNYYYTRNYGTNETQSVSTHEFGHSIGLAHSSTCVIMNPDTSVRYGQCGVYTPQSDDDNGVDALY